MKNIVYIHGAHSSATSFNYLKSLLPNHNALLLEYTVDTPFIENEKMFINHIQEAFDNEPFDIIGHSMGGLYAAQLLNEFKNAERALTISSPYGGSKFVEYLRVFAPQYQLFKDIKTTSPVIKRFTQYETIKPFLQIVTTGGGNPLMGEDNDGTVTRSSQMAINIDNVEIALNHFEVLLSNETVNIVKNHLYP